MISKHSLHAASIAALLIWAMPTAQGQDDAHAGHDHAANEAAPKDDHAGHDHDEPATKKAADDPHAGHNHAASKPAPKDDHAGHDHDEHSGEEGGHDEHGEEGHADEVKIMPEAMAAFGIKLETASVRLLGEVAVVPARVAYNSEAMAHVGTPVAGRASEIKVRLGDVVAAGDLLAVIQSPDLGAAESDLLQQRSLLEATKSGVEVASIAFQRAEELRATNSVSVTDFLARQGELTKAKGDLAVSEATYVAAENRLHILGLSQAQVTQLLDSGEVTSRFELRAPIAGTIVQREVTPGEIVGPDSESLMMIADMATLWVLADVPERVVNRVRVGSKGLITVGFAEDAALNGTVAYVAPELNPRTRTAQVRLVVDVTTMTMPDTTATASHDEDDGHGHDDHAHEPATMNVSLTDEAIAAFKAKGDWCGEHGLPESQCAFCNPALAVSVAAPAPMTAKVGTSLLRPGMFANVEIELAASANIYNSAVIAIPEEAVQTVEGNVAVFVPADEPNTFKPQQLMLGRRVGKLVHVISGLQDGDQYVATGSFILKAELGKAGAEHVH